MSNPQIPDPMHTISSVYGKPLSKENTRTIVQLAIAFFLITASFASSATQTIAQHRPVEIADAAHQTFKLVLRAPMPDLVYPAEALDLAVEGKVVVEYRIDKHGDVIWTRIKNTRGYGLDESAADFVTQLKFDPRSLQDEIISQRVFKTTVTFRLK